MSRTYFGYTEEVVLENFRKRESQTDTNNRLSDVSTLAQLLETSRNLREEDRSYIRKLLSTECVSEE